MSTANTQAKPFKRYARIKARRSAVQALYQWLIADTPIEDIINEFINERAELKKSDIDYFKDILSGVVKDNEMLQQQLVPLLDRNIKDIDPIEKAILMIGCYELTVYPDLPYRVVLDEAINLAKMFGAEQSYKYINGVLDKAAQINRAAEINSSSN